MNHEIDSNIERLAGAGADLLVIRESVRAGGPFGQGAGRPSPEVRGHGRTAAG